MSATLEVVIERSWIRDGHNPADALWRALILAPGVGIVSAAESSPWRAIARAGAHLVLRRRGLDRPTQAQEDLSSLMARAQAAQAAYAALEATQAGAEEEASGMIIWFVGRMNALGPPGPDGRVCLACMKSPAAEPHSCPFRDTWTCRCCESCERRCL
jgi:hypothetical protein